MNELISYKEFYQQSLKENESISEEMVKDCFAVFACRHKFCREVCPVYAEERNESYGSYGFHTALLSVARGVTNLAELANSFTYCLECGACELRCPTTLFAGDFYKATTTTVDLVRKVRRDLVAQGIYYDGYDLVKETITEYLARDQGPVDNLTSWARDLDLPKKGQIVMFVDYFNAFQTTEVPRLTAMVLQKAGIRPAILEHPAVTTGELLETDLPSWLEHARRNIAELQRAGAQTVVFINPHDYSYFVKEYPKYLGSLPFKVVYITDFLVELITQGKIKFREEYKIKVGYHDPCSLNKLTGVWQSPRQIIKAIPGIEYEIEDNVTQWNFCCGNGVSTAFRKIHPDISYRIGMSRLRLAQDQDCEQLLLACPHCKDQLIEVKVKSGLQTEPVHIIEAVAKTMGIER